MSDENIGFVEHSVLDDLDKDALPGSRKRSVWDGWHGSSVMLFGVLVPLLTIAVFCVSCPKRIILVSLNHPIETLAELCFLIAVPVINYRVWANLCEDALRFLPFSRNRAFFLGMGLGTTLIASACVIAMIFGNEEFSSQLGTTFDAGYLFIAGLSLAAGLVSAYLINEIRKIKAFANWQIRTVFYATAGIAISLLTFVVAEARPWCVRYVERMAVANSPKERKEGLYWLRQFNPEKELRLECSDPKAAGLCGLFLPIATDTQKELYFTLTGKPFSYKDCTNNNLTALPDDYLGRNVVGDKKAGLSLVRSSMTGAVHPGTLSSTIDWTLVFKNDSTQRQEARAEIRIPQGAVVTGLSYAGNGQVRKAFCASSRRLNGQSWTDADRYNSTMITELGHNRKLVRCSPILPGSEVKLRVRTVVPMASNGATTASFVLPRFVATNFDVIAEEHTLRLRSPKRLTANLPNFRHGENMDGDQLLMGSFTKEQAEGSNVTVLAAGSPLAMQVLASDKIATKYYNEPSYAVQSMVPIKTIIPRHLVVVIDGSDGMQNYVGDLRSSLGKLPMPGSLIVASQEQGELNAPVELSEGLKNLDKIKFVGGQDNLKAIARATDLAGESEGGAVLWIHGPQAVESNELYLVNSELSKPTFYELQVDSGDTDTMELFKNHPEIGPFVQIPNCGYVSSSIDSFISKWKSTTKEYAVENFETYSQFPGSKLLYGQEAAEIIALRANAECMRLLTSKKFYEASRIAVAYGIVTPISSAIIANIPQTQAVCIRNSADSSGNRDAFQSQVATNGTVGPQMEDATNTAIDPQLQGATNGTVSSHVDASTYVPGVNTSGTVRVNNLANLEAFISCFGNALEILAIAWGSPTMIVGFLQMKNGTRGYKQRILLGALAIMAGLSIPGSVSCLFASARDANYFS